MNFAESMTRKMLGIEDLNLPQDYSASKGLAKDIAKSLVDPFAQMYRRGQEKSKMPLKDEMVAQARDTGAILSGLSKSAGKIATTVFDAGRVAYQGSKKQSMHGTDWDAVSEKGKFNVFGKEVKPLGFVDDIKSYQRSTYENVRDSDGSKLSTAQHIAGGMSGFMNDVVSVYGTTKAIGSADKYISGGNLKKTPSIKKEMQSKTRVGVIDNAVRSGDVPRGSVFVEGKKNLLRPEVAQGRIDDYAQVLNRNAQGFGDILRMKLDPSKMHLKGGKIPEVERVLKDLYGDTMTVKWSEGGSLFKLIPKKMNPHPSTKGKGVDNESLRIEYDMRNKGQIQ